MRSGSDGVVLSCQPLPLPVAVAGAVVMTRVVQQVTVADCSGITGYQYEVALASLQSAHLLFLRRSLLQSVLEMRILCEPLPSKRSMRVKTM